MTGALALVLTVGSAFLLGFLLRELWRSKCLSAVKQFIGEALDYVVLILMVRPAELGRADLRKDQQA